MTTFRVGHNGDSDPDYEKKLRNTLKNMGLIANKCDLILVIVQFGRLQSGFGQVFVVRIFCMAWRIGVLFIAFSFLALISACTQIAAEKNAPSPVKDNDGCIVDVRAKLLVSARKIPSLCDTTNERLVEFAYYGYVNSIDGPIYVVHSKMVITAMLAPRGVQSILFFDKNFCLIGQVPGKENSVIHGCRGGKLYFFGTVSFHTAQGDQEGNVLDFTGGYKERRLYLTPMYTDTNPIN